MKTLAEAMAVANDLKLKHLDSSWIVKSWLEPVSREYCYQLNKHYLDADIEVTIYPSSINESPFFYGSIDSYHAHYSQITAEADTPADVLAILKKKVADLIEDYSKILE